MAKETGAEMTIRYAIAWFHPSDWDELKSLCVPNDLQDTHEEWLANVHAGLAAQGLTEHDIEKVILTPDDLRDWKSANGGEINSKVRATLAAEIAAKRKHTSH
jgi:hypothetical protein